MAKKTPIFMFILLAITAIGITISGVIFKQSALRMIPLYVSLVIFLLQSSVNRFAPLIGGINSVFYAIVYFYYELYATAIYSLIVSCPLQIITFINWSKRKNGKTVNDVKRQNFNHACIFRLLGYNVYSNGKAWFKLYAVW